MFPSLLHERHLPPSPRDNSCAHLALCVLLMGFGHLFKMLNFLLLSAHPCNHSMMPKVQLSLKRRAQLVVKKFYSFSCLHTNKLTPQRFNVSSTI